MLKIGIVGLGYMGRMHYRIWNQMEGARVTAVCDSNPNIRREIEEPIGNIPGATEDINFNDITLFHDFNRMIAESNLDAVSITLPTYMHADATQKALGAGYHVLCEKPMALSLKECDAMVNTAKEKRKILQIGQCIRFWPEYAVAKDIAESGKYGALLAASFRRLGSPPSWGTNNWFENENLSGGLPLDLHLHDTDFIQYLLRIPEAVSSSATVGPHQKMLHMGTQYFYPEDIMVSAEGSWIMSDTLGFEMSFNLMLEQATLVYNSTTDPTFKVFPASGDPFTPDIPDDDGYFHQIEHFAGLLKGENLPEMTTPEQSRESVRIVLAEIKSIRRQERIHLSV